MSNKHVFEDISGVAHKAILRINPIHGDRSAEEVGLQLRDGEGNTFWYAHDDAEIDLAAVPISASFLEERGMKKNFFESDKHTLTMQRGAELGLMEGDGVFILGYPMGRIGEGRNFLICRHGTIARIRDTLEGTSKSFYVDGFVFPGNSGGPVMTKPEVFSIEGTSSMPKSLLIGVVKSSIQSNDVAVSTQTGLPRVVFSDNSGLTQVIPIDYLTELLEKITTSFDEKERQVNASDSN